MSTKKKNIFFYTYLETKTVVESLILSEVINFEELQKEKELEELRELIRKQQEELERLRILEESGANVGEKGENLTDEDIDILTEVIEGGASHTNDGIQVGEEISLDTAKSGDFEKVDAPLDSELSEGDVPELPTEESIVNQYAEKISQLRKLKTEQLYHDYSSLFDNFDFYGNFLQIRDEISYKDDLMDNIFFKQINAENITPESANNFLNYTVVSDTLTMLFLMRLGSPSIRIFDKVIKKKIKK